MSATMSPEEMMALAKLHGEAEFAGDLDATMATVCEDPYYEIWPVGYRLTGRQAVMELYQRVLPSPMVRAEEVTTHAFWLNDDSFASEDTGMVRLPDGTLQPVRAVSVYTFTKGLLKGERVYMGTAGDVLMRDALGPDFLEVPGVTQL